MFQIEISSLKPGVHELEHTLSPDDLDLSPELFRTIHVDTRLDLKPGRVLVQFTTSAIANLECDRTLVMYEQPVEGTHAVLFTAPDDADVDDDDVYPLQPNDQAIDLTEPVRDTLMLSLPVRRVAPGADAAEIPTTFGAAETDVDPRWEALRSLRSGDE